MTENDCFYTVAETDELRGLLRRADALKAAVEERRAKNLELWETVRRKLRIDWTYNSNAIEGNTLTYGETAFFLEYGLTVEGKPLKDFLEARNHAEAIDFLYQVVQDERPISAGLIKEINALLLLGVTATPARNQFGQEVTKRATPGEYKTLLNRVLQPDGSIHRYTDPIHVAAQMDQLVRWISQNTDVYHPCIVGAVAHYNMARVHPFDDGNGRGARILMNLILLKRGYPAAVIRAEDRRRHIEALVEADRANLEPFIQFVAESLIQTEETMLQDLSS